MIKTKSDGESRKECSKSISQNMEEKMIRQSQERVRNQSSNISNTDTSDHVQLKRQNMPRRWERFGKMIKKKRNKNQYSATSTIPGDFITDRLSKNEMQFDVTQWDNTLWTKKNKHLKFSLFREDDHVEANNDGALEIDVNSPFAKEVQEEIFYKKTEKGNYLMKRTISVGVSSLELAAALTAIIILLFTIDFKGYSMLYPLCNTAFTSSIIIWLILTHSLHLYLEEYRNNQGIIEYYVPIWKKYLFLYAHITRCGFSLISTAQTIYFLIISTHQILFHLITAMLIIHFCCAFVHLYFAAKNRFALSFKPNGST
ncbi:Kinectin [Dirofilaria immitis]